MIEFWWRAARPASLIKILLPLVAGLSIGFKEVGLTDLGTRLIFVALTLLFGWLDQLMIIFLNDYADADADLLHAQKYPELIDQRAVPNGWLTKRHLLKAGLLCAGALIALTVMMALLLDRLWAPLFAGSAIALIWAYSVGPIKLNYRGLGETLETAGVGFVLPFTGFYFYSGALGVPVQAVIPLIAVALASALLSGVKHWPADRETGKHTASVLLGTPVVRWLALSCVMVSAVYCAVAALVGVYHVVSVALTVVLPLVFAGISARHISTADHLHLKSLKKFKNALQRAFYATNAGIILSSLFGGRIV